MNKIASHDEGRLLGKVVEGGMCFNLMWSRERNGVCLTLTSLLQFDCVLAHVFSSFVSYISKEKRLTQGLSDVKSHKRIWRGNQAVCAEAGSKGGLEEAVEPVIELQHNKDVCLQTPKDLLRKRRGAHNRVAPLDEVGTEERVLRHESH